jgi:copper chaperone CopZ
MFNFGKKEKVLAVEGMTCHHCEMTVEKALLEVAGIKSAKADHATKSVAIQYKDQLDLKTVKEKIEKAGYRLADLSSKS